MAWKRGPLPPGTYNWGGIINAESAGSGGFFFADFRGDHAVVIGRTGRLDERVEAGEILWYDNGLELPPPESRAYGRAGAEGGTPDA
jgi:hypothetical protein